MLEQANEKIKDQEERIRDKANESVLDQLSKKCRRGPFVFYTGFEKEEFYNLFNLVVPTPGELPFIPAKNLFCYKTMKIVDQFFCVLIKLRCDYEFEHLGHMFDIDKIDCGSMFRDWINFLYHEFASYPIWGSREAIFQNMPEKFKAEFPTTFGIIDCTEIKIQRPSSLRIQSMCWSEYKGCHTFKALVSVEPSGSFNFVSMLFSGSISDKEITNSCGFLTELEQLIEAGILNNGDSIMADKGFHISKEIEDVGLELILPPFATSGKQMSKQKTANTKKIAKHRVVVENSIGRAKKYKIIAKKINLTLFPVLNQIFFVCCILTNFKKPILGK